MKRLALLSLLCLSFLWVPGDPAHAQPTYGPAFSICTGDVPYLHVVNVYNGLPGSFGKGKACLKVCKSALKSCNGFASSMFKCRKKGLKAISKDSKAFCLAEGTPPKTCTQDTKNFLATELSKSQSGFETDKGDCAQEYGICEAKCTP